MVKLHTADWPQAFVAVQVTIVVPSGKQLPDGGVLLASTPLVTKGAG
jgi:hypothetical protein